MLFPHLLAQLLALLAGLLRLLLQHSHLSCRHVPLHLRLLELPLLRSC